VVPVTAERSAVLLASRAAARIEHDLVAGVDLATTLLLWPLVIDFRGWTWGDQGNETWM
jgi:hypothetical protein